jgi:hypothetical protein
MPHRAARVDRNHREIADALERCGWTTIDMSAIGRGIPDLYIAKAGRAIWVEIKDGEKVPSARQLTEAQEKFHAKMARAGVPICVITSVEEALAL